MATDKTDSVVVCKKCDRKKKVTFGQCLRDGWPRCHDATMELIRRPSSEMIKAATDNLFKPLGLDEEINKLSTEE